MSTSDLSLYQNAQEISVFRPPAEVLAEAQKAAAALKDVVIQTKAAIRLGESEHLKSEAWQTLGHFYGLTGRIKETRFVQFGDVRGFEAFAELVHVASGKIVSTAESMCLSDESRWSARTKYEWKDNKRVKVGEEQVPLFQLRSMAQTRAISRVHANALKWVVVLAGYNPTPAEEIMEGDEGPEKPKVQMPQRKAQPAQEAPAPTDEAPWSAPGTPAAPTGNRISEPQRKRMYAIMHQAGKTNDDVTTILKKYGFEHSADVTKDKYEAICKDIEAL